MPAGSVVESMLKAYGWTFARRTIVLEGDTDERYLRCAARLAQGVGKAAIFDNEFNVTSCGSGEDGGIPNLSERFIAVRSMADKVDVHPGGRKVYHFAAFFDGDDPGRRASVNLIKQMPRLQAGRDVFVLQHVMPVLSGRADTIEQAIKDANVVCRGLVCVIEDLVGKDFIDLFVAEELEGAEVRCDEHGGFRHIHFTTAQKSRLCRFFEQYASFGDATKLYDLLCALRAYVGAPPIA